MKGICELKRIIVLSALMVAGAWLLPAHSKTCPDKLKPLPQIEDYDSDYYRSDNKSGLPVIASPSIARGEFAVGKIPIEGGDDEDRPPLTLYYPIAKDADANSSASEIAAIHFLEHENPAIVLWSNGMQSTECSRNYAGLIKHWASYGVAVAAEESPKKRDFSDKIPRYSFERTATWIDKHWKKKYGAKATPPHYAVILAGKSRGGSQAATFARKSEGYLTNKESERIKGVICIGGCGLSEKSHNRGGLFITGDRDRVALLINAEKNVSDNYKNAGGEKQYFNRAFVRRRCGDGTCKARGKGRRWDHFGKHIGHDDDPVIRVLTTDWLRCKLHGLNEACRAVLCQHGRKEKKSDTRKKNSDTWKYVKREIKDEDMLALLNACPANTSLTP